MKEEKTIQEGEAAGSAVIPAVSRKALIREWGMKIVFIVAAAIFVVVVAVICIYLFARAVPTIGEIGFVEFVFGGTWNPDAGHYGVGTLIVGTRYATAGALVVGVPIGLLVAVFMSC